MAIECGALILVFAGVQFFTLFQGPKTFHFRQMSGMMTTVLLSEAGIEILAGLLIFAVGNLFFKE